MNVHCYNARRLVETDLDVRIAQKLAPLPLVPFEETVQMEAAAAATEVGADDDMRVDPSLQMLGWTLLGSFAAVVAGALWAVLA